MRNYYLVLEDDLLKLFYEFKSGQCNLDIALLFKLLNFYKKHITNVEQLKRIGINNTALQRQLAQQGYINESLEYLAQKTKLKIILSKEKNNYPYVNINGDIFESNFTATYERQTDRSKAVEHILALVKEGNKIEIYDKYLLSNNGDNLNFDNNHSSIKFLEKLINSMNSNVKLEIYCKNDQEGQQRISYLQNTFSDRIAFHHNNLRDHDRYIRVFKNNTKIYEII